MRKIFSHMDAHSLRMLFFTIILIFLTRLFFRGAGRLDPEWRPPGPFGSWTVRSAHGVDLHISFHSGPELVLRMGDERDGYTTPPRSGIPSGGDTFSLTDLGEGGHGFRMGAAERKGGRQQLEDEHAMKNGLPGAWSVCAVYDGHGGRSVSRYLKLHAVESVESLLVQGADEEALRKAIDDGLHEVDRKILDRLDEMKASGGGPSPGDAPAERDGPMELESDAGSTACFVFLNKQLKRIVAANVGDSRAVLCRNGEAKDLTTDQKPSLQSEKDRIKGAGGVVYGGRVCGLLGVSRSFGDIEFKRWHNINDDADQGGEPSNGPPDESSYLVVATPEVQAEPIEQGDKFVIVACDGVWDVLKSQEAVDCVISCLKTHPEEIQPAAAAADALVSCALERGSTDNCTAVVCLIDS